MPSINLINAKTELTVSYRAIKKGGRKASHVEFTINSTKSKPKTSLPEPIKKLGAITIFKALTEHKLIELCIEHGESSDDLIGRIRQDVKNNRTDYWIEKLQDFGIKL